MNDDEKGPLPEPEHTVTLDADAYFERGEYRVIEESYRTYHPRPEPIWTYNEPVRLPRLPPTEGIWVDQLASAPSTPPSGPSSSTHGSGVDVEDSADEGDRAESHPATDEGPLPGGDLGGAISDGEEPPGA